MAQASAPTSRYVKLGAFILAAIIVLVALLVVIGSGRFDRNRIAMETYFNESVQGLDVGSKVKYRGVTVGEVTRITFTHTKYELNRPPAERKQYVLVESSIQASLVGGRLALQSERQDLIAPQVARGLRVRLTSQGITGTSYLEVDYIDPKTAIPLEISWRPEHLYLPSAPSTVSQLMSTLDEVVGRIRKLDLEGTIDNFNRAFVRMSDQLGRVPFDRLGADATALIASGTALVTELRESNRRLGAQIERMPIDALGRDVATLLAELRQSNAGLKRVLEDPALAALPGDTRAAVNKMRETFENPELARSVGQLQRTVARLERLLVGREGDLASTLENLRHITDNLRDTSELARRQPSQILFGGAPAPATATQPTR